LRKPLLVQRLQRFLWTAPTSTTAYAVPMKPPSDTLLVRKPLLMRESPFMQSLLNLFRTEFPYKNHRLGIVYKVHFDATAGARATAHAVPTKASSDPLRPCWSRRSRSACIASFGPTVLARVTAHTVSTKPLDSHPHENHYPYSTHKTSFRPSARANTNTRAKAAIRTRARTHARATAHAVPPKPSSKSLPCGGHCLCKSAKPLLSY
jgi:hypothetical protein